MTATRSSTSRCAPGCSNGPPWRASYGPRSSATSCVLLFQPVVSVADGNLAAVEALVRWQHPTRGLLAPGEFIPAAEESELIVSIGTWVIEEACVQIRRWREAHPARLGVPVSVNVSARQLSPSLVDVVAAALGRQ